MKLTSAEQVALEIFRAGLWGRAVNLPEGFNEWTDVMKFAKNQSIMAIIAKTIISDNECQTRVQKDFRLKLKSILVSNVMAFNAMTEVLKKVSTALKEAGIEHVLLKGHSLAKHYPYPETRQCGDIDLYVGIEKSLDTHRVLSTIAQEIDPESDALWGKHYDAIVDDVHIEVHRHTNSYSVARYAKAYNQIADKGLKENLGQVTYDGVTIAEPSMDFYSYYIFDHIFEHFLTSGIGLRHLADLMLFLHDNKDKINQTNLKKILEDMDMMKPWQLFGCILVKHLGMPAEEFPFYAESDKADWAFGHVIAGGNFGKSTKYYTGRTGNYLSTKLNAIWCHITRGAQMMRVFPRQEMRHFHHVLVKYLDHLRSDIKKKLNNGR